MIIDCHGHDTTAPASLQEVRNVFFDTCVHHQPGIDLLLKVIPAKNILFGSEMVGAVRGVDPESGQFYDDTKRYIEASSIPDADKTAVFEGDAKAVFPRLAKRLAAA